jgi:hypothetical protein
MNLKQECDLAIARHRLWLLQKCKVVAGLHAEIAAHLFLLCQRIGVIPQTPSHVSPILRVSEETGRQYLTNFTVNRYVLTTVLDWALRRGTPNNAISVQFMNCLEGLCRGKWAKIVKNIPTPYHVDSVKANALEIMFRGNPDIVPIIPRGILVPTNEYITLSGSNRSERTKVRYRQFFSVEGNLHFYGKESLMSEWADNDEQWRIIRLHQEGFLMLGISRGYCLPRLAITMAVRQFVALELGPMSHKQCELVTEHRQSLMSRDNHKFEYGFPWEAYLQIGDNGSPVNCSRLDAMIIRASQNDDLLTDEDRAQACGIPVTTFKWHKRNAIQRAKSWYDRVGLDLD